MPITDDELDKIVKNLKAAFDAAAVRYESEVARYGANDKDAQKMALDMATLAQPYLLASKEQAERARQAAEADSLRLPKSLKTPGTTP